MVQPPTRSITISVIVPVWNSASALPQCLNALLVDRDACTQIIVVDDASDDDSVTVAAALGVRVLHLDRNVGPGPARNHGGRHASGDVLLFVDADVVVAPGTIAKVERHFEQDAALAAVLGSYDASPAAPNAVSQYRNLLHHFVHQTARAEASHFWAGLGAIRKSVFLEVGGFDEGRYARAIEDVELGYRLRRRGYRIRIDKTLQGTHLKRWSLRSMIATDFIIRGVPWTGLLLERRTAPDDFSLAWRHRLSVVLAWLVLLGLVLSIVEPMFLLAVGLAVFLFIMLNRALFVFFARRRGGIFALKSVTLHLLYNVCSGAAFLYGIGRHAGCVP